MTGEGREYGRRRREEIDEEVDRIVREAIDEMVREEEERQRLKEQQESENKEEKKRENQEGTPRQRDLPEQTYCPGKVEQDAIQDMVREEEERQRLKEQQESEKEEPKEEKEGESEQREIPQDWDVDRCVREAVKEVQEEEIGRQRLREDREHEEMEKEHEIEASYESRRETADKENIDEGEERVRENYGNYGIDPEEVKERWQERFEEDVKDEVGESSHNESKEREGESAGQENSVEGHSYYDDGSGQVYEVKMDSKESSSVETESSTEAPEIREEPASSSEQNTEEKSELRNEEDTAVETEQEKSYKRRNSEAGSEDSIPQDIEKTTKESSEKRTQQARVDEYQNEESDVRESSTPSEVKGHQEEKTRGEVEGDIEVSEQQEDSSTSSIEIPEEQIAYTREMCDVQGKDIEVSEPLPTEFDDTDESVEESESELEIENDIAVSEEVEKSIEELAEDIIKELKAQEEEETEVETPHIIIDAMTGQEHIDHTYEYRPYYQETEEESSEQASVDVQERIDDAFAELPEEEREKIREKARSRLKTEEDLDELLEQHPSNRASPDFDEKYEDAKKYIRGRQKSDVPRLIKELLKDEVRRVWTNYVLSKLQLKVRQFSQKKFGLNSEKEQQLYRIHQLHSEINISEREIVRKLGISRNQVRNALRDYEIHERYYRRKETLDSISSEMNLSVYALRNIFKHYGWHLQIQTKRPVPSNSEVKKLHLEDGLTFKQISLCTGLSLEKIRKIIGTQKGTTTEEEIHRLYFQEGLSFEQISSELGISMKTIRRTFSKHKWKFRKATTTKHLDTQWVHHLYYVEGFSTHEIANILGIHSATVQKLFHEQQWIPRSKSKPRPKEDIDFKRREYQKSRRGKLKETRIQMFGTTCFACKSEKKTKKNLHLHRKDGKEHSRHLFRSQKKLESLRVDEWSALCDRCHLGVTLLMKSYGYKWNDIESFLAERDDVSKTPKEYLELSEEDIPVSQEFEGSADDLRTLLFGDSCSVCGNHEKSLILHRKDGKTHDPQLVRSKKYLQKIHPGEWAHVCGDCHNIAHWALEKLGINWSKLTRIFKPKK